MYPTLPVALLTSRSDTSHRVVSAKPRGAHGRGAADLSIRASNPVNGTVHGAGNGTVNGRSGGGSGLGLVGIAERVSLLGGHMRYGQDAAGRFELQVTLPLTTSERP